MKQYPEIKLIEQPNIYACYPTCVSILTGIPLEDIFKILGHDGSEDKGFDYEEIALTCLYLGWSLICISKYEFESLVENLRSNNQIYRMILWIKTFNNYHTVAWDGKSEFIINPAKKDKRILLSKIKNNIIKIDIIVPIEKIDLNFMNFKYTKFKSI